MREKTKAPVFSKEQLMDSREFVQDCDIIKILADDDKNYTKSEMRRLVDNFRAKEVN